MPSFDPSYYLQRLNSLEDDFTQTDIAKNHFYEFWLNLRPQWNDHAGRQIELRNIEPLFECYSNILTFSQQHITSKQQAHQSFNTLQQQLFSMANQHEVIDSFSSELAQQVQLCKASANQANHLNDVLEDLNQDIERQISVANSQITAL